LTSNVDPSLVFLVRECFKEVLALEGQLEASKVDLRERIDFTLAGVFNIFSGYSQARIGGTELLAGLERLGVSCDISDVNLVIDRYDSDRDGKLSFWEFSNALLPIDPISRDEIERRKAVWEVGYETKEVLRRVFKKIIDTESRMESIRERV
jgi:hypothetical protein